MRRRRGPSQTKEERALGVDTCREMEAMDVDALEQIVIEAHNSIKTAKDELEKNEKYQEVKRDMKALTGGMRDVKKRQTAKIEYALKLREAKGK
jgi:hypothetical protein